MGVEPTLSGFLDQRLLPLDYSTVCVLVEWLLISPRTRVMILLTCSLGIYRPFQDRTVVLDWYPLLLSSVVEAR